MWSGDDMPILNDLVIKCLESNAQTSMSRKDIARYIFETHRDFCEEKRLNSRQDLTSDNSLLQQIAAEIKLPAEYRVSGTSPIEFRAPANAGQLVVGTGSHPPLREVDLYDPLVCWLRTESSPPVYAMRISESRAVGNVRKGENKWLFPDVVGVRYIADRWRPHVRELAGRSGEALSDLLAFEVKLKLSRGNLREAYFQAVSNTSWADEAWLVARSVDDTPEMWSEMRVLHTQYGIGILRIDPVTLWESSILVSATPRDFTGWDMVNRLAASNLDFREYVDRVLSVHQTGRLEPGHWK